ncbi:glycosyltransferase family 2 protein [Sulfolobus tengchongensis]|uniref:Glycosyltransferase family 2 protein n=1 Tax=Sulfolobus tengchongensis TaxID=207809 RepID=A0AAX4L1F0_9CREN
MEEIPIIVLNYNGIELLKKYLPSVLNTKYPYKEVVVVDNGSKDGSVEYVKSLDVKIIPLDKNYGPAYARNIALKRFKTKFMAFLDNDVRPEPDWLDILLETIKSDENIAATQSLYTEWPYDDKPRLIPWFSTAAALVRRDIVAQVGGFDEHYFFYWEDAELSWRLYRAGYKILMVPKSKVYHEAHGTFRKLPSPFTSYLMLRNQMLLLLTYYEITQLLTTFPLLFLARFFQSLKGPNRVAQIKALFSLFREGNYISSKRKFIKGISKQGNIFLKMLGDQVFGYEEFASIRRAIIKKYF